MTVIYSSNKSGYQLDIHSVRPNEANTPDASPMLPTYSTASHPITQLNPLLFLSPFHSRARIRNLSFLVHPLILIHSDM